MNLHLLLRPRVWLWASASVLLPLAGFVAYKTRSVALELTDPPFYRVPSKEQVDETYQELATGNSDDPGGTWEKQESEGLQLWTLVRARPSKGAVLLLHGFGDDRWGTSPALRWFPGLDATIFTCFRRDDALRAGTLVPPVTFGDKESDEVVKAIHLLESRGWPRKRIVLMGRSLGASVGILALVKLEQERKGPLAGIVWEGAPASSRDFGERLVRGTRDRFWHPVLAPVIGNLGSRWAARIGRYDRHNTDLIKQLAGVRLQTPSICFLATQDRLASPDVQRSVAFHFTNGVIIEVPTWHLQCSQQLGPKYSRTIQTAVEQWLP